LAAASQKIQRLTEKRAQDKEGEDDDKARARKDLKNRILPEDILKDGIWGLVRLEDSWKVNTLLRLARLNWQ